jgi:methylenetetrahydrofolate dehydrogenase (NADP+) / methenyltetrahydrofolate cyclohydrolase
MSKIISGTNLAKIHQQRIHIDINHPPHLVSIFNGEDKNSMLFTKLKQQKAEELGIIFSPIEIDSSVFLEVLETVIGEFNRDTNCHGILLQLPLPQKLQTNTSQLIDLINRKKDVDGLNEDSPFIPATVKGVLSILESESIDLSNTSIALVGSEGFIGQQFQRVFNQQDIKYLKIDKVLKNTSLNELKDNDLIISCVGINDLIKPQHLKKDCILIDVGLGDFDPSCYEIASRYTPKMGGVGPMTIIALMENVVESLNNLGD